MHVPNRTSTAHSLQRLARCQRFLSRPTSVALTVLFLGLIPLSSGAKAESAGIAVRIDNSATQLLAQNDIPASTQSAEVKSSSADKTTSTAPVSDSTDSATTKEEGSTNTTSDSTTASTTTTQPASDKDSATSTASTTAASTASTGTFADNSSSGTKLGSASFGSLGQSGTNHKGVLADGGLTSPGGIAKWLLSTIVVLGFIFLVGYWLKRSRFVRGATSTMQLETQISLGPKERIVQMRVGERHLLLGVTAHNINLLLDLNAPTAPAPVVPANSDGAAPRAAAPRRVPTSRTQAKRYEADDERDFSCQALARDDYAADYYDNPIERSLHEHERERAHRRRRDYERSRDNDRNYDYDERRRDYDHGRDYDRKRSADRAYRRGAEAGSERGDAGRHDYADYERDLPQFAEEYDDERYAPRAPYRDSRRELSLVDDLPFAEESAKRSRRAARNEYEHESAADANTDKAHGSTAPDTAKASQDSHNILAGDAQATAILRAGVNDDGDDVPSPEATVSGTTDTSSADSPSQAQEVATLSSATPATADSAAAAAAASAADDDAADYDDRRHYPSYSRNDAEDDAADAYDKQPYDPDYDVEGRA